MMMMFGPFDLAIIGVSLLISFWAQGKVKYAYAKYSKVGVRSGITGVQIARRMMAEEGISDVDIELTPGVMTDHYDPGAKVVRLSEAVYHGNSIASLGIAAHEIGHVIQHAHGYTPMHVRSAMYPVSRIGSTLAFPLILGGIFISSVPWLLTVGIYLYAAAVAFTVITLPVEFNASKRALVALNDGRIMTQDELHGAKKVLDAAAMTYVAAATAAVLELIRLILIARMRD